MAVELALKNVDIMVLYGVILGENIKCNVKKSRTIVIENIIQNNYGVIWQEKIEI